MEDEEKGGGGMAIIWSVADVVALALQATTCALPTALPHPPWLPRTQPDADAVRADCCLHGNLCPPHLTSTLLYCTPAALS